MNIKDEIERLRQQQIEREEALKAQLLGEIEELVEKGVQKTLRQAKPYLVALDKTGCRDYLEELRRTYDLKYKPERHKKIEPTGWFGQVKWEKTPAVEAVLETNVDVGEDIGGWSLSANRLADEIQDRFDEIRQSLINRLGVDSIRKMVQDPAELEEFRQELHEELGVRETKCARVRLDWDYRCLYAGTYASGDRGGETYSVYGSNTIEAVVSRENDKRRLYIEAEGSSPHIIERGLPEEEWRPTSIREAIVQGFLKLTRDSLG